MAIHDITRSNMFLTWLYLYKTYIRHRALRDGVAGRPWVLCPELSTRVLVDGLWFCLWKIPFWGGYMESLVVPVPWPHPPYGSLKPTENLFFELLAASGSTRSAQDAPRRLKKPPTRLKSPPRRPKTAQDGHKTAQEPSKCRFWWIFEAKIHPSWHPVRIPEPSYVKIAWKQKNIIFVLQFYSFCYFRGPFFSQIS